jgi:hypothetical protein
VHVGKHKSPKGPAVSAFSFGVKPEEKRQVGRTKHRGDDNNETVVMFIGCIGLD